MRLTLNGDPVEVDAEPTEPLLDVVRRAGCVAPKEGCGMGVCGACTVIVGDLPVSACLYLAGMAEGATVWTAEGLTAGDPALVDAFADAAAFQCGFCTPGQVTMAWWIANRSEVAGIAGAAGTEDGPAEVGADADAGADVDADAVADVDALMAGNLCRCTGYQAIRAAVEAYRGGH